MTRPCLTRVSERAMIRIAIGEEVAPRKGRALSRQNELSPAPRQWSGLWTKPSGGSDMRNRSHFHPGQQRTRPTENRATDWIDQLGQRVKVIGTCWIVDGRADRYPQAGPTSNGHRYVYEQVHRIKLDRFVDVHHTCEHPGCINPAHLVALTKSEHRHEHERLKRLAAS